LWKRGLEKGNMDIILYSRYCVEKRDYEACCGKNLVYALAILYYLVKRGDWVLTKEIMSFVKARKARVLVTLRRLFKLNIVEKRYAPSCRGRAVAFWRVREGALNGYEKTHVLKMLKEHIKLCLAQ